MPFVFPLLSCVQTIKHLATVTPSSVTLTMTLPFVSQSCGYTNLCLTCRCNTSDAAACHRFVNICRHNTGTQSKRSVAMWELAGKLTVQLFSSVSSFQLKKYIKLDEMMLTISLLFQKTTWGSSWMESWRKILIVDTPSKKETKTKKLYAVFSRI